MTSEIKKGGAVLLLAFGLACDESGVGSKRFGEGAGTTAIASGDPVFPLKVSDSGHHLVDQRGAPFLVNGDTPWSLTHNLTYDEAVRYMENRKAKGINALIVSAPDAYGPDGKATDPPDRSGNRPFVDNEISRPNEPYWQNVDKVLAKSEEMGFLVLFFPGYLGCCNDGYLALLQTGGPAKARTYGRFVGQRYAGRKNIVWVHGGDRDPGEARDVVAAIRDGIRETAPRHLHATHWAPETAPYAPFGRSFADLYLTYTYKPVSALVWQHYSHQPTKPVLLVETNYEDDWAGKRFEEVRKYPYRALLSGAAGHFFGNKPLWFCGYGWESALESPGSRAMEHVGRLFRSRPWERLVPNRADLLVAIWERLFPSRATHLVVAGQWDPASNAGVQAGRADDGSFAMAFLPDRRTVRLNLAEISGTTVRAWWFDIATGTAIAAGEFPTVGRHDFTPPSDGSFVLVLDDASRGFPPPGGSPE
jgi:hypothetical protein